MADDDRRHLPGKEASPSSPNYFRQDTKEELKREAEKGKKQEKLQLLKLKMEAQQKLQEQEEKSRPVKEREANVMGASEKTGSAKEFTEKERVREEAREEAKAQGAPEGASEEQG